MAAESGDDATLSAPGADATLASGPGAPASSPPLVRAGRADDYRELLGVDPKHYVVGKEIARGGMGRILTARDRRLGRPVAIKELLYESSDARARFEREARITAKLQHPAIVNILEAGSWPGGEPFYVMKLVIGESLDKVIGERTTLESRLGLLPNVIAAVDALAYAHSVRVIHRDLKPGNVLVGEFGETVVIDWGLAKDLADTSGAPDLPAGPYRSTRAAGETVAGSIMGTPAYMPIEQATGDSVDERADVYALGAMLYHVLAGAPPYTGKTSDDVLERVIKGPPQPLAERAAGVPPDLVTIVEKAMAHDAADRYPTAKGLADDLKKFQTGQLVGAHRYSTWQLVRRWIRRHRTPVVVAGVATLALVVVGVVALQRIVSEQARTQRQREAAVQSRGEAEDLMSFMLGDLRDKLQPLGKLELLDDVATRAVAYYDRRGDDLSDAELAKRALALRNVGDVLSLQGHADVALEEYGAALEIAEMLAAKDPTSADRQLELSTSHEKVGNGLRAKGDTAGALAEYRTMLTIRATLVAKDAANADRQRDLGIAHERVGDMLFAQADGAGALVEYRTEQAIFEMLAAKDPTSAVRQRDVAVSHQRIGDVLRTQGDVAGALAEYRTLLAMAASLATKDPTNADRQWDLSLAHNKVGDVLRAQGDASGALAEFRLSLAIREALAAGDPTNANRQRDVAVSHDRVANVLAAQGDATGALVAYRAAQAIRETLASQDPTNTERQRAVSISHDNIGDVLVSQGDFAGALAEYRAEVATDARLAANDPTNAEAQRDVSVSHGKVGIVLLQQGDAAGALVEYRASLAIREQLAEKDATSVDRQADVAFAQGQVGDALLRQKDVPGALASYRAALAIAEALAAKDPTSADRQRELSISHNRVGDALLAQADAAAALDAYRTAQAIATTLAAKDPTNADLQKDLAYCEQKIHAALAAKP